MTWTDRLGAVGPPAWVVWFVAILAPWVALAISWDRSAINSEAAVFVGSGILGCMLGAQLGSRRRQAAAPERTSSSPLAIEPWTWSPDRSGRQQLLKSALENIGNPEALRRSPLMQLPSLSSMHASGAELRELLVNVVTELTVSPGPRDQEAGRLLLDYYVRRVGSHEVVMQRLCLSRPTFYRRLQRGLELVAGRLDSINESARRSTEAIA